MSTNRVYSFSKKELLIYYSILGIDIRNIDIRNIETEARYLEELTPNDLYAYLPASSKIVNNFMLDLFETLSTRFGDSEEELKLKESYYKAVIGILNTVTLLNLLPEGNENYYLHFERLNSILSNTLSSINNLEPESVISVYNLIMEHDINGLRLFLENHPVLMAFVILALKNNTDNNDYDMFDGDTALISYNNLMSLLRDAKEVTPDFQPNTDKFLRLSYLQSKKATRR